MNTDTGYRTGAAAVVGALLLAVLAGTPAMAHTQLADSSPAEGETVTSLDVVRLEFSGDLLDIGAGLRIQHGTGGETQLDVEFPEPTVVAAEVPELADGEHTLVWRVVSSDGHPIEGVIEFSVVTPAPTVEPSTPQQPSFEPEPPAPSATAGSPSASPLPVVPDGDLGATAGESLSATDAALIALAGAALVTVAWLISRIMRLRREEDAL
ncbi:MAG: copper resistance CopC family protein [Demequina sp.]